MTTEIIDKLFLELGQISTAKTGREIEQAREIERLQEANRTYEEAFRSMRNALSEIAGVCEDDGDTFEAQVEFCRNRAQQGLKAEG